MMNVGDAVWLLVDGAWRRGEVRTTDADSTQVLVGFGSEWKWTPVLEAENASYVAIIACQDARDKVVKAAESYASAWEGDNDNESCEIYNSVKRYHEAYAAEIEARAKLGAFELLPYTATLV